MLHRQLTWETPDYGVIAEAFRPMTPFNLVSELVSSTMHKRKPRRSTLYVDVCMSVRVLFLQLLMYKLRKLKPMLRVNQAYICARVAQVFIPHDVLLFFSSLEFARSNHKFARHA